MASGSATAKTENVMIADSFSKELATEEGQLNVYKDGLLEYLRKLTEGNGEIRREVHAIVCKEGFEKQEREKSRMEKVLEEQNAMLKELIYGKEDEISRLEKKIREMELASLHHCPVVEASAVSDSSSTEITEEEGMYLAAIKVTHEEKEKYNKELWEAASKGKLEDVKGLLDKGAFVDARDSYSYTPLMHAAIHGHWEVAEVLLSRGAAVNAIDNFEQTPLMWAAHRGHLPVVKLLLSSGANVKSRDADGMTALRLAKVYGRVEVADLLKRAGSSGKSLSRCIIS